MKRRETIVRVAGTVYLREGTGMADDRRRMPLRRCALSQSG